MSDHIPPQRRSKGRTTIRIGKPGERPHREGWSREDHDAHWAKFHAVRTDVVPAVEVSLPPMVVDIPIEIVAEPPALPVPEIRAKMRIEKKEEGITMTSAKTTSKWGTLGTIALTAFIAAVITAALFLGASYLMGCGGTEQNQEIAQMQQDCHTLPQPCKVTICHYPPGNPENPQTLTISCWALETHERHHQDHKGACNCEQDGVGCPPPPPPPACGDQVCNGDETCSSCPNDCGSCPPPPPTCGDLQCNGEETCESCALDCGRCYNVCGDQICDEGESCVTCPTDCGVCPPPPPVCGDTICNGEETCDTCSQDCGRCPLPPDAGVPDSGTIVPDSSTVKPDAAVVTPDSSPANPDSAIVVHDSTVPDSGSAHVTPDSSVQPPPPPVTPPVYTKQSYAATGGCNVIPKGMDGIEWLVWGSLMFFGFFLAKKKRRGLAAVSFVAAFLIVMTGLCLAFPTQNARAAVGSEDYWVTEDAKLSLPIVRLTYGYEHEPLKLVNETTGKNVTSLISDRHMLYLSGAYTLGNLVQVGASLPLVLGQYGPGVVDGPVDRGGIGNINLMAKVLIWKWQHFSTGLSLTAGLPTSTVSYVDDNGFTITPNAIISTNWNRVTAAVNLGWQLQDDKNIVKSDVKTVVSTSRFAPSAAVSYEFYKGNQVQAFAISDLFLSMPMRDVNYANVPVEWMNGLAMNLPYGLSPYVAIGVGLTSGAGDPDYRVWAGLGWAPPKKTCPKMVMPPVVVNVVKLPPVEVPVPIPVPVVVPVFPPIYFAFDSFVLDMEAQITLEQAVSFYKETKETTEIELVGHTDARGSLDYNQKLSELRTKAAKDYLVARGVKAEKITTSWKGKTAPAIQDAKTEKDHAWNRRVTIHVSPFVVMPGE